MPRNVRNFWLEVSVDGNEKEIGTGPRSKDGGFSARIYMRDNGGVLRVVNITGSERNGELTLLIDGNDKGFIRIHTTR